MCERSLEWQPLLYSQALNCMIAWTQQGCALQATLQSTTDHNYGMQACSTGMASVINPTGVLSLLQASMLDEHSSPRACSTNCIACLSRYIRYLHLPNRVAVRTLAVAAGPAVLLAHSWGDLALHALSVNGRPLVSMEGTERLHALACSPDGRMCVTGGAKGTITLRWLHSLQV